MKRRLTALLTAAVLCLGLWGCKKNDTEPQKVNPTTTTTIPVTTTQPILVDNPKSQDIQAKQEKNADVFGWIVVPGTNIDYPLLQSGPTTEEDFYLNHDEIGEKSRNGAIYIQKQNGTDFRNPNTIIYGHNMADESMFRHLHLFRQKDFFDDHDTLTVYLPGHILTYRIYAVVGYGKTHLLADYNFYEQEDRQAFIDMVLHSKSRIKQVREDAIPTTDDYLVTLSTCTNDSDADDRLLLIAVLESDVLTK